MKTYSRLSVVGVIIALVFTAVGIASAQPKKGSIRIEFMMYSGRHNPVVTLDDPGTIAAIKSLFSKNRRSVSNLLSPALEYETGYSGISISNVGSVSGLPSELIVHRKKIVTKDAAPGQAASAALEAYAEDTTGRIESTLIEYASKAGVLDASERKYLLEQSAK